MAGLSRHCCTGRMGIGEGAHSCVSDSRNSRIETRPIVRELMSLTTANLGAHPGAGNSVI